MIPIQFSIFLPVRNGGSYVKECIKSILKQSYPYFELNVLDNDSTDGTVSWVTNIDDQRIHLYKSQQALSIEQSWARIKGISKQKYMTTIGHDDIFDPHFLEEAKILIEKYPEASLYQTAARYINADGKKIRSCMPVASHETAAEYLTARFNYKKDVYGTGYVMLSEDYDRAGGIPPFEKLLFADDALWLTLLTKSFKTASAKESIAVRIHTESESASMPGSWKSTLLGLQQFSEFLGKYIEQDEASKKVVNKLWPRFITRYLQNLYIFALLEASQQKKRIDPAIREQIQNYLLKSTPGSKIELRDSMKVKSVEFLNYTFLRLIVPYLWKVYYNLRTRSV